MVSLLIQVSDIQKTGMCDLNSISWWGFVFSGDSMICACTNKISLPWISNEDLKYLSSEQEVGGAKDSNVSWRIFFPTYSQKDLAPAKQLIEDWNFTMQNLMKLWLEDKEENNYPKENSRNKKRRIKNSTQASINKVLHPTKYTKRKVKKNEIIEQQLSHG